MNQFTSDDELIPEEAAAFLALPRATPQHDRLAEERTVRALREAGLLAATARRPATRFAIAGAAIAAATLIFVAGALYGRGLAAQQAGQDASAAQSPAIQVQQAGTAYVSALVRLSRASDTERTPGLEAGTATLRAAATSLASVNPNDSVARRIRSSLLDDSRNTVDRTVIWF